MAIQPETPRSRTSGAAVSGGSLGAPTDRGPDRRFQRLVETIPAIVYVETDERPYPTTYLSPRIEEVLGHPTERFLQERGFWATLLHPDDAEAAAEMDRRAADAHGPYVAEYRLRDAGGEYHWFRDEAVFVRGEGEAPGYWQGVMFEITRRKEMELRLHEIESRHRNLIERIPAVVYIEGTSSSHAPSYVSPQYEELLGYTPEERMAEPEMWTRLLHPDDRDRALAAADRAGQTGEPFSQDYRLITKDGHVVWVHDETVMIRDPDGAPLYWQGVLFDITKRKRAEDEAQESAAKYQALVEQLPAIVYIDPLEPEPVRALYVSPHIERMLGFSRDVALSNPDWWEQMLHPDDRRRAMQESHRADNSGEPYRSEYRFVAADGRTIWVRDEAVLVRADDGTPLFWQGLMHDITDEKRVEQELTQALEMERLAVEHLREADELKSTFLTAVSHDLRTPLATILGNAITLERADEIGLSDEEREGLLRGLARKARHLTELVTDLLDLDRLTRGVVEPRLVPIDVGRLVATQIRDLDLLEGRSVEVDVVPAVVPVDASMVNRIVENLVANTTRHTPEDASVWVRVHPDERGAIITVEDDGPGVPEELRETLFRAFERGPSANPHSPGMGVGLSLVARFAELHGGRAWVEERPGGGASFHVLLALPGTGRAEAAAG